MSDDAPNHRRISERQLPIDYIHEIGFLGYRNGNYSLQTEKKIADSLTFLGNADLEYAALMREALDSYILMGLLMKTFSICLLSLLFLSSCADSPKPADAPSADGLPSWYAKCKAEAQYVYIQHPQGDVIYDSPAAGMINCRSKKYKAQIAKIMGSNEGYEDIKKETELFASNTAAQPPAGGDMLLPVAKPAAPVDMTPWCAAHVKDRYIPVLQYTYWGKCKTYMKNNYPDDYALYLQQHYSADYQNWRTRSNYSYQHGGASRGF